MDSHDTNDVNLDSEVNEQTQANASNLQTGPTHGAPSESSESSSNEYVKFDDEELKSANFLADGLADDLVTGAFASALQGSRFDQHQMDERDLYVPENAGDAAAHPIGRHDEDAILDEFDPLAKANRHGPLETVEEKKPEQPSKHEVAEKKPEQTDHDDDTHEKTTEHTDAKKHDEHQRDHSPDQPRKSPTPEPKQHDDEPRKPTPPLDHHKPTPPIEVKDNAGEDSIVRTHHTPLTEETAKPHQELPLDMKEKKQDAERHDVEDNIREAVEDSHHKIEELLGEFAVNSSPQQAAEVGSHLLDSLATDDQNSPSADSDTIGELRSPKEEGIPPSESVSSGMRDLSPELTTYERDGPLTIPLAAAGGSSNTSHQTHEVEDTPRPPTPPKELDDVSGPKPQSIDLGPPPHVPHRSSEHGLPSILKRGNSRAWIDFKNVHPGVLEILHWRDPKKSAAALAVSLLALILFAKFSFISLVAWVSLLVLGGTVGFRVYRAVEGQVKKTDGSNPFKPYLEPEISVPQEKVHAQADVLVQHAQNLAVHLRHLFLVENLFDSIKFGVFLWTLTYVGAWFSGVTLLTLLVLGLFTLPKVYELYQEPIDQYIQLARENVDKVHQIVQDKIPQLKAVEKEEKKDQ
ncbi:hypothetical protein M3Y94_00199400 [Aphelenchoides besseyi]|nr:hypothetical protein M3Y94_00199400 [Aphelenchoides besseyi]KAI6236720.1 hypothetical protein M3Y95_00188400 [Aphelenchoides besseyi]